MRSLLLASALVLGLAASGLAAPGLPDRPPKWEYAELTYRSVTRPGGRGADGDPVALAPPTITIRWITAAGELEVKGWDELATKLKATGFKKDTSASHQKIQVLNFLGSEGWELMELAGTAATAPARGTGLGNSGAWMFKRPLP
jgi:hypothetical protein